jgi:hypothetical protein
MSLVRTIATALPSRAEEPKMIDFAHDIVPILKARCAECHTNGKHKGSLSLDTRGALLRAKVVVPGKPGESELLKRITSRDPDERMPPKGERLSEQQIALMRAWIDQGLPWQEGFTFTAGSYVPPLKPRRPLLPAIREGRDHPIDRILDTYHAGRHQALPARLDDVAFARRLYLDVIGQLPAPDELTDFLKDTGSDNRARLIRRLLDDRRAYAEHWLTFWNDLLRNDYQGTGYIDGGRKRLIHAVSSSRRTRTVTVGSWYRHVTSPWSRVADTTSDSSTVLRRSGKRAQSLGRATHTFTVWSSLALANC